MSSFSWRDFRRRKWQKPTSAQFSVLLSPPRSTLRPCLHPQWPADVSEAVGGCACMSADPWRERRCSFADYHISRWHIYVCVCLWRGAATWKWQEQHHHTQTSFKPLELMFFISVKPDGLVILSVCCWASSVEFFYWNWLHIVTFFIAIFDLKGADISF